MMAKTENARVMDKRTGVERMKDRNERGMEGCIVGMKSFRLRKV
jgi:hypothetical protein